MEGRKSSFSFPLRCFEGGNGNLVFLDSDIYIYMPKKFIFNTFIMSGF
jgi:hypothetical protein